MGRVLSRYVLIWSSAAAAKWAKNARHPEIGAGLNLQTGSGPRKVDA